jgi:hypothetical protein
MVSMNTLIDGAASRLVDGVRRLVEDAEGLERLGDLGRDNRGAVVAERRPRQSTLLDRLRQVLGDVLGVLRPVPLDVAGDPGPVIERAEQDGRQELDARRDHLLRGDVAVPVPQAVHVGGLVAAELQLVRRVSLRTLVEGACWPP